MNWNTICNSFQLLLVPERQETTDGHRKPQRGAQQENILSTIKHPLQSAGNSRLKTKRLFLTLRRTVTWCSMKAPAAFSDAMGTQNACTGLALGHSPGGAAGLPWGLWHRPRHQHFGKWIPSKDSLLTATPRDPRVLPSAWPLPNAGPKLWGKRCLLQVSPHTEQPRCTAPEGETGQHQEARLFVTPTPGRGICLAGVGGFLPFQVPHGELSSWIPSPLVALPNQRSLTISEGTVPFLRHY